MLGHGQLGSTASLLQIIASSYFTYNRFITIYFVDSAAESSYCRHLTHNFKCSVKLYFDRFAAGPETMILMRWFLFVRSIVAVGLHFAAVVVVAAGTTMVLCLAAEVTCHSYLFSRIIYYLYFQTGLNLNQRSIHKKT